MLMLMLVLVLLLVTAATAGSGVRAGASTDSCQNVKKFTFCNPQTIIDFPPPLPTAKHWLLDIPLAGWLVGWLAGCLVSWLEPYGAL